VLPEELHSYSSCSPAPFLSHQLPYVGRDAELSLQILLNCASSSADTHLHSRQPEIKSLFWLKRLEKHRNWRSEAVQL